ncbi:MAG: asparagine synthase (glutamine-hydrolyzing) [Gammaproteobacteria bacterium]|nr:asparagine synthase (glutamine-hydrolyzing) [Gammaproteobacteria bacterium]
MCGLAGFIVNPAGGGTASDLETAASKMADTLHLRGPDDAGAWSDPAAGLALGHRRLAVIDLSEAGRQPMVSSCKRWVIAYNGEIYNATELRSDLAARGRRFRGHSDTEVVLEGCAEWGVRRTLERMIGMFAFAAWDREKRSLYLARDRLGIKPLYWGEPGGLFLFGSELKALRAYPGWTPRLSPLATAAFLRSNYIPNPLTIYEGVHMLPPGTVLTRRADGSVATEAYWRLEDAVRAGQAAPFAGTDGEALDTLEALLLNGVKRRMVADVPLGVFLSGGIDSSTVAALMQSLSSRPVRTFSIGFREPGYDEAPYAKAIAAHLGTEHTELYVTPNEARDIIPRLPEIYDEPLADPSQIPTHILSVLAREHVTVALSGDGGDELFAGYDLYTKNIRNRKSPSREIKAWFHSKTLPLWNRLHPALRPQCLEHLARYQASRLETYKKRQRDRRQYHRLDSWDHQELMPVIPEFQVLAACTPPADGIVSDYLSRMLYIDTLHWLPDDILAKVDRASMATSLEVRVPLLDHRIVEFAWRLPNRLKLRGDTSKWALRNVLYRHVPRKLIDRPKQGFFVSYRDWLRGPLRGWAEDLLDKKAMAEHGLFETAIIRERWNAHSHRKRDWTIQLWTVLMFQAWWRRWMR